MNVGSQTHLHINSLEKRALIADLSTLPVKGSLFALCVSFALISCILLYGRMLAVSKCEKSWGVLIVQACYT